jgi:hypothetical protein
LPSLPSAADLSCCPFFLCCSPWLFSTFISLCSCCLLSFYSMTLCCFLSLYSRQLYEIASLVFLLRFLH